MTADTPAATTLATKPCVRCRVEINAACGYCTLCGASQRVRRPAVRWLIGVAAAGVVAAVAAAGVLVFGGAAAGGSQLRLYRAGGLATLVPSRWLGGPVAAPPGITRVAFSDPADTRRRLTITAQRPAPLTALARAHVALDQARARPGFRGHFFGRIRFSDGRPAWLLTYDSFDSSNAVYVFSACLPTYAVTVELRAPNRADLLNSFKAIPVSVAPRC